MPGNRLVEDLRKINVNYDLSPRIHVTITEAAEALSRLNHECAAERERVQGLARDAAFNAGAADNWKAEAEKQRERADKFMWQVRDTCTRAEAAEARALTAEAALAKAVEAMESLPTQIMALDWKARKDWTVEEQADRHGELQEMIRDRANGESL